jgi:hypothetical protein
LWAHLDLNQGPHPYQGCALTNLSYEPERLWMIHHLQIRDPDGFALLDHLEDVAIGIGIGGEAVVAGVGDAFDWLVTLVRD